MYKPSPEKMQELIAKYRAMRPASLPPPVPLPAEIIPPIQQETQSTIQQDRIDEQYTIYDRYGNLITLNDKQRQAVDLAAQGKSFVLIGAAGTGKTTVQKAVTQVLINTGRAHEIGATNHKHLTSNSPGILITSFTRRSVTNIRNNVSDELKSNCITIHKTLEYQPVYYEIYDAETGKEKTTMRFEPARTVENPLPNTIGTFIFEESSMIGTDLHQKVMDASPHCPVCIYLGDIQQLPPIFGPAILGYKLLELPVIELTEVYRQAFDSPIIKLAHRILSGKPILPAELPEWNIPGKLTIKPWKKKISEIDATATLAMLFKNLHTAGHYNPDEDMILMPFNKGCGTIELNKYIANYLARLHNRTTHQIIAGFNRLYLSVGDKILFDKEDAVITSIEINPAYYGAPPLPASPTLDYWGCEQSDTPDPTIKTITTPDADVDFVLAQMAMEDKGDRVRAASHIITIKMLDTDETLNISNASDLNAILLGYALTVHKAQGSEFRRVFLTLHHTHATMIQRELLYTAVTRAREELYIVCEPNTFEKGIKSQKIKGNTLEEKAEYFKGRKNSSEQEF